jgi:hypothetical protein
MKIPLYALPHRATVIPFKGSGAYGPTWETDPLKYRKNVPCRIDPKIKKIKGSNGDDVVQSAEALIHPDWVINVGDKLEWMGKTYAVESVDPIDAMGIHHWEVVLAHG